MEMKKSEEVLAEVHRNCQLALQSISNILPETEDAELREELMRQHENYERICGRAAILAKDKCVELKNPSPIKKAMMWSSIKMNTMTDNSRAHIAEMMVQGTVMGITALKSTLAEVCGDCADAEIVALFWSRDDEAIPTAQAQYGQRLLRLAQQLLRSPQDAEECLNDTWLRAWNAIPPERPGNLFAYLARVCRNLALDRLDRRGAGKRAG